MILDITLNEDKSTVLSFGNLVQFDLESHYAEVKINDGNGEEVTILPYILEITYCKDGVSIGTEEVPASTPLPYLATIPYLSVAGQYVIQFSYKDSTVLPQKRKTFAGSIKFNSEPYCENAGGLPKPEYEYLDEKKTDKGGYLGTSQDLKNEIDNINIEINDLEFDDLKDTPSTKENKFIKGNTTTGNLEYTDILESDITDLDKYTQSEVNNLLDNKVDKVVGKGLSEEDFTTELKSKVDNTPLDTNEELDKKVDKVTGKGLSENDYIDADKAIVEDALVKGLGYDDVKFPNAKAITDDLEQKVYALDNRLVYAFEPGKRNIENLKYGMYVKDPLTNGDGTIKSEDVDSMAGVFNDEDGSFYCGDGYSAGSEPVGAPPVKDTAPDGKLIIKEPWTSETHSFIFIGVEKREDLENNMNIYSTTINGFQQGGEFVESLNVPNGLKDVIVSKNFSTCINNNVEYVTRVVQQGISVDNVINFTSILYGGNQGRIFKEVFGIFAYYDENNKMTEAELRYEYQKIKSGQYYIENTGVYEPVQGAKKRANEYGRMKDYVYVNSNTTDIQLVETDKIVITEIDGVSKRDVIDSLGAITGDGGIVDVNGYIRLATNVKTKVVIEVD